MNGISPWAIAAQAALSDPALPSIFENKLGQYQLKLQLTSDSLWVRCNLGKKEIAFRAAYSPDGKFQLKSKKAIQNGISLHLISTLGTFKVTLTVTNGEYPILRYTTALIPSQDIHIPFWPRDIIFPSTPDSKPQGEIHVTQVGARSGLLHFTVKNPALGSILYLQNLTALANYNEQTQTSAADTVGGLWPELGFALPPTKDHPIKKHNEVIINDAFIVFDEVVAETEVDLTKQYLNMLAGVYLQLPKPATHYIHWPDILQKGLHDLVESPGCWSQVESNHYFNAYVSDYETPPEIMVQLAVLLPLADYMEWGAEKLPVMDKIREGLPAFYDDKLKTIMRWLPAAADKLKGEEEQKVPLVMDSWYLHHPLLNLSRLALKGDQVANKLFLDSLGYAIKVAHHFKYKWPVFYKMDTLEVVKAETKPGEGGQHDVAGLFAHVMLQAYELTKEKKYLQEAEKAAKTLEGYGFKLFYQANNTSFAAGALLRLYKLTKNETYLNLSYLCLANVFQNVKLWDCDYGHGKNYPSFFALFPLSDAPYTAVYEEQEVFCALHDYLIHAKEVDILPSVTLLCSEYIRYLVDRAAYYYPPLLPKEMLSDEVKIGEVDEKIWIALEDLHDGWEQSGEVGQEVYGAGNAFGILPRHYTKVKNQDFMLYADYPISSVRTSKNELTFHLNGDSRIECRFRILPTDQRQFKLINNKQINLKGTKTKEGHHEFMLMGNQALKLSWTNSKIKTK